MSRPKLLARAGLLLVLAAGAASADEPPAVRAEALDLYLRFLGSPELGAKRPGEPGLEVAAAFLDTELERLGLAGAGRRGRSALPFEADFRVADPDGRFAAAARGLSLTTGPDFRALGVSPGGRTEGPVVFAGYGRSGPDRDDFAGVEVGGRIVLAVVRDGRAETVRTVTDAAARHGAAAVVLVPDPRSLSVDRVTFADGAESLGRVEDRGTGFLFTPSGAEEARRLTKDQVRSIELGIPPHALGRDGPTLAPGSPASLLVVSLSADAAWRLLDRDLAELLDALDAADRPGSYEVPDLRARIVVRFDKKRMTLRNVAARIGGSDPKLASRAVVVAARYDGRDPRGAAAALALADALRRRQPSPRGVTFLFLVGGEDGQLGARHAAGSRELSAGRVSAVIGLSAGDEPPAFLAPFRAKGIRCRFPELLVSGDAEADRAALLEKIDEIGREVLATASKPAPPAESEPPKEAPPAAAPTVPPPTLDDVRRARLSGRLDDAAKAIEAALDSSPGNADLYLERARIRIARKEFEKALADAENLDRLEKGDGRAFLVRSEVHFARGDEEAGFRDLERAATVGSVEALLTRALLWLDTEDRDLAAAAVRDLARAFREGGETAPGLCARGIFSWLNASGRADDAIRWLGEAIERDPLFAPAWLWRGIVRVAADERDRAAAIADLVRAEELGETNPSLWFQRGLAELTSGMYSQAIRDFETFIEKVPEPSRHAAAVYNIACAHALMRNREEALDWLGRAVTAGFRDSGHARADPDLESIRDDPRFESILRSSRSD